MKPASLRVLAYHRIAAPGASGGSPSLVSATPEGFGRQVEHLAARYRVVSLGQVLDAQRGGTPLPSRALLITFDDGYTDFADIAWPILRRHGLPATVFVPTAFADDPARVFWWDRLHHAIERAACEQLRLPGLGTLPLDSEVARQASLRALQEHLKRMPHAQAMALVDSVCAQLGEEPGAAEASAPHVLGWPDLRRLASDGVDLAAHTSTHPALTQLPAEQVRAEVRGSLADVARHTGRAYPVFCCPFGLFDERVVAELEGAGVELAFTCVDGHNRIPSVDPLRLRRTSITPRTTPLVFPIRLWKSVSYVDMWRHRPRSANGAAGAPGGTRRAPSGTGAGPARHATDDAGSRIAYIMSRFPKLSETFVLNEILAVEAAGVPVELFPLLRERQPVSHPEALRLVERARFEPFLSRRILGSQAYFIRRRPKAYFGALFEVLRGTLGSANFFVGTLGIFPKTVRFAHEMQRLGVTHVHAHFCSHPAAAALIIHRLTGIPFSFTAHGSDLHVERRMLDRKLEASAFAATVCEFNRDVMVRACGERLRHKIHVIRCGIDPGYFGAASAQRSGRPFRIVSVASLEPVKGHRYLIEACALLQQRGLDFRCQLVGAGPLERTLALQVERAGLGEHVQLLGGQPRAAVARLLRRADVAVLASHPTPDGKREGVPVALMEAMAAGLPVVASSISGIPELVDHGRTGVLVPSGDAAALADALERLARDGELRRRMGAAGRQKVVREFSLETNVAALLRLIRAVDIAPAAPEPLAVAAPATP